MGGKLRILVADDKQVTCDLMVNSLASFDSEVEIARDGYEALEKIVSAPGMQKTFDLLITDIDMPLLSGDELIQRLRDDGNQIPVLVITANGNKDLLVKLMKSGVTEYLDKPYRLSDFRNCVNKILMNSQNRIEQGQTIVDQQRRLQSMSYEIHQYESHFTEIRKQAQFAIATYRSLTLIRNNIPGLVHELRSRPYHDLGGDFCAVNPMPFGYDFFLADVAGHDIGASYIAVMLKAYFEENRSLSKDGEDFFLALNRALAENGAGRMVCAVFLRVHFQKQTVTITCAAHPAPIHVPKCNESLCVVDATGTPLGFNAPLEFDTKEITFDSGDRFFIFTDGLISLCRTDGITGIQKTLGVDGICTMIKKDYHESLKVATENIWNGAHLFSRQRINDDLMFVGLEMPGGNNV